MNLPVLNWLIYQTIVNTFCRTCVGLFFIQTSGSLFFGNLNGFTISHNNFGKPAAELVFDEEASNCQK